MKRSQGVNIMIGKVLKYVRIFNGMKAKDLAYELGISPTYLSEIENGKKTPAFDVLEKYSDYFKVRKSVLMFFAEELNTGSSIDSAQAKAQNFFLAMMEKSFNKILSSENLGERQKENGASS